MAQKLTISEQLKNKYHKTEEVTNFKEMLYRSADIYRSRTAFKKKNSDGKIISITYEEFKNDVIYLGTSLIKNGFLNKKIAVIGKNGKGKSTLLKVLAGVLPASSGNVIYHTGCVKGYYEQTNVSSLNPDNTIEEEIQSVSDNFDRTYVRNICGAMLFEQDAALKKIKVLSGGEKSRVMLGKIIASPLNVLMLDEPTNHLDMDACDSLIEAVDNFPGAVIMVTHNEMFLHALANRLIVFQDEYPYVFEGTYEEFLEKEGWQEETAAKVKEAKNKLTKKDARKIRSEIIAEKNKVLKPLEQLVENLENEISECEKEVEELNNLLIEASSKNDGILIGDYGRRLAELNKKIDDGFIKLDNAYTELESYKKEYEEKLNQIEE